MPHAARKLTPVLMVEKVEPCVAFWERLGWVKVAEVPHEDALGFAILVKDGVELMYQSRASVAADLPPIAEQPMGGTFLFLEIDDLDGAIRDLGTARAVVPRRQTFYGMDEYVVQDPAGNMVIFAMKLPG